MLDLGVDGLHLRPAPSRPLDVSYQSVDVHGCDGDWSTQGLTEQQHRARFRAADEQYAQLLKVLLAVEGAGSPLHGAQSITDGALHTVRDLSRLLHPAVLDDLGLPEAVDAYLREFSKRFAIKVELHLAGMASRLAPDIEVAAYRMIQEALTNVAKHARASRCDVTLERNDDKFEVLVRDDGEGFSATEVERWDA